MNGGFDVSKRFILEWIQYSFFRVQVCDKCIAKSSFILSCNKRKLWYFVTKEAGLWANGNHSIFRSSPRPKPNPLTQGRGEVLIGFLILLENAFPTLAICGYNSLANMQPPNLNFSFESCNPGNFKLKHLGALWRICECSILAEGRICIFQNIHQSLFERGLFTEVPPINLHRD